ATCAIMRSKHMTECIPTSLRPMWDPEGGHGMSINQRWQAAANCAAMYASAGCPGTLPPTRPPNIPGLPTAWLPPVSEMPTGGCTTGMVSYSGLCCEGYGADRFTDFEPGPPDWDWIMTQLNIP